MKTWLLAVSFFTFCSVSFELTPAGFAQEASLATSELSPRTSSIYHIGLTPREVHQFRIQDIDQYHQMVRKVKKEDPSPYTLARDIGMDAARLYLIGRTYSGTYEMLKPYQKRPGMLFLGSVYGFGLYSVMIPAIFSINHPLILGLTAVNHYVFSMVGKKLFSIGKVGPAIGLAGSAGEAIAYSKLEKYAPDLFEVGSTSFLMNKYRQFRSRKQPKHPHALALERVKKHMDLSCQALGAKKSAPLQYSLLRAVDISGEEVESGRSKVYLDGVLLDSEALASFRTDGDGSFFVMQGPVFCLKKGILPRKVVLNRLLK